MKNDNVIGTILDAKKTISFTLEATPENIMGTVKRMLKRVGAKGKFCRIQYKTKTGEVVERTIKLKVTKYLKADFASEEERIAHKEKQAAIKANNPHLINAWDLTAALKAKKTAKDRGTDYNGSMAYRSYDVNNILTIKGAGQMIILDDRLNRVDANGVKNGIPLLGISVFNTKVAYILTTSTGQKSDMVDILTGARKRKHSTSVKQTIESIVETLRIKETGLSLKEIGYTLEKDDSNVTATHTNGNKVIEKTGTVTVSESKGCTKRKTCDDFGYCHGCSYRMAEKIAESTQKREAAEDGKLHVVFIKQKDCLSFQTSDGRTGSNPLENMDVDLTIKSIERQLQLPENYTLEIL